VRVIVRIDPFESALAPHFARLNREWIERFFVIEPADLVVLDDPQAAIIDAGGMVFFALLGDDVVGTCAVVPHGPGTLELARMAVSPAAQGRGIGRLLGEKCIRADVYMVLPLVGEPA
jgi:GNAT superfamily N-acetyltransferase